MRTPLVILVLLALGAAAGPARSLGDDGARFERWYRVERDGEAIGWMCLNERTLDGHVATLSVYKERTLAFGQERPYTVVGEVWETPAGVVSGATRHVLSDGSKPVERYGADRFDSALGPSGAAQFIAARLAAGAQRISIRRVAPLAPERAETLTLTGITPCSLRIGDRDIEGFGADWGDGGRLVLDARGYPIRAEFDEGARRIVFRATSREEAIAPFDPSESVVSALVPITTAQRRSGDARFRVERLDGREWDLPSQIGRQRNEPIGSELLVGFGSSEAQERDQLGASSLAQTRLINFDSLPRGIAPDPAPENAPAKDRACELERWVAQRLETRSFAVRLGDAATAAERREGDCTEHAVLLAALLRRGGIPARVVGGLIAIEHDGRPHMTQHLWVQALLETDEGGVWEDLDSTLGVGAEAPIRIALGATGVTDESVEDLVRRLGSLAGLLRVEALTPE